MPWLMWLLCAGIHQQHINITRFSNHSPHIFATSSFDKCVKMWDVRTHCRAPTYECKCVRRLGILSMGCVESGLVLGERRRGGGGVCLLVWVGILCVSIGFMRTCGDAGAEPVQMSVPESGHVRFCVCVWGGGGPSVFDAYVPTWKRRCRYSPS